MLLSILQPQSRKSFFIQAFLLGIFLALGFDPYNIPFLSLLAIGLLFKLNNQFYLKYKKFYKGFFFIGIAFGFGFFISSTYWISNALFIYGGDIKYLLPFSIILLPFILSIFYIVSII